MCARIELETVKGPELGKLEFLFSTTTSPENDFFLGYTNFFPLDAFGSQPLGMVTGSLVFVSEHELYIQAGHNGSLLIYLNMPSSSFVQRRCTGPFPHLTLSL